MELGAVSRGQAVSPPTVGDITIYLAQEPVDFRLCINGLSVVVKATLRFDPVSRNLFCFTNKRKNQIKVLYWQRTGFCLWQKRLQKERFRRSVHLPPLARASGTALVPVQPIPKSNASPGLLGHVASAKFADGLPLYRQEVILARYMISVSHTALACWMIRLGDLVMPLINLMDETQLAYDVKGFWNGARPPYGYMTVTGEQRGARIKKRLAVDLVEAEVVRLVFRLFQEGHEGSGPMGVKAITSWLNQNGYRIRSGAKWGIGPVHTMLTNTVYAGQGRFNRAHSRTRARKSETEVVIFEAPIIIDPAVFEQVQARLKERNPRVTPPRVVSGPILLTGLAFCASCDGAMTLRTGTSRNGKVHRYYTCSTCARAGKAACKGRSIRMDRPDHLVTVQLLDRLLAPDRLKGMLETLASRRAEQAVGVDKRISALEDQADEADTRLRRLYKLVEDGLADMDDILKDRLMALKAEREAAYTAADRAKGTNRPPITIAPAKIEAFGQLMRERLTTGDITFRKAYLGAIIERVEVDDAIIRIVGRKDVLEAAVTGGGTSAVPVRSIVSLARRTG